MPSRAEQVRAWRIEGAGQKITQWVIDKTKKDKEAAALQRETDSEKESDSAQKTQQ